MHGSAKHGPSRLGMRRAPGQPCESGKYPARAEAATSRAVRSPALRHTYATFALRAGVPVSAVSRFMGSSIAMIDHHYGHLAHDSRQHAVSLLDALAPERAVDAAWTSTRALPEPVVISNSRLRRSRSHRRVVRACR